jgi:putative FmdB family regulatory protein
VEVAMPQYTFLCKDCQKTFTVILRVSELEKGGIKCPECQSEKVEQQLAGFFAITGKKS